MSARCLQGVSTEHDDEELGQDSRGKEGKADAADNGWRSVRTEAKIVDQVVKYR